MILFNHDHVIFSFQSGKSEFDAHITVFIHAVFKNIRTCELRAIYLFFQSLEFPSLSLQYSEFYGAKLEASINSTLKYATSALNCWNIFSTLVVSLLPPWLPAQMSSCRDYLAADQTSTHPISITSPPFPLQTLIRVNSYNCYVYLFLICRYYNHCLLWNSPLSVELFKFV